MKGLYELHSVDSFIPLVSWLANRISESVGISSKMYNPERVGISLNQLMTHTYDTLQGRECSFYDLVA